MIKNQISFFIKDTYRGTANDPLSLNLYTYCANNPLVYIDPTGNTYVPLGVPSEYVLKHKDSVWRYDVEWMLQTTVSEPYKPNYGQLLKETISEMAGNTWNWTKNTWTDIWTDEDRTDKSAFSYTPETKAKYDEELLDKLILPGASTDVELGKETGKAFGEIRDYGIDKGTDEAAKWALGEGFGKLMGPIIGRVFGKSGDDVAETFIKKSDDGLKVFARQSDEIIESSIKFGNGQGLNYGSLGEFLGEGGNKIVYSYGDNKAVGILKKGKQVAQLTKEIDILKQLDELGLPVVDARPISVDGTPAILYDRYALGSKNIVKLQGKKVKIVGESPLLNQKSIEDLKYIKKTMVDKKIKIDDLQFLIGDDGHIVISDPIKVHPEAPSKNNLRMIDLLIEAASANQR